MFRRKEDADTLFDTTDPHQLHTAPVESATVINPVSAPSHTAAPVSANAFTNGASVHASSQPIAQPAARSIPEPRPVQPQSVNAFRPNNAPLGGDLPRNRMPEAKAPIPAASPISAPASVIAPSSSVDKGNKSVRRVLTVGNDILLKGEIATCDRLVIEGKVDATLNDVHTVEIAENGSFRGSAQIEDAEISGVFDGDLVVRNRLVIYATGKVRGKITYGEIEIERGGELTGEIKTIASAGQQTAGNRASRASAVKESKFEAA